MRGEAEVEVADVPAAYLDLADWSVVGDDIVAVQWLPRTEMGKFGNHVLAVTARVILRLPGGKVGACKVESPEGVLRLRQYMALRPAFLRRAA